MNFQSEKKLVLEHYDDISRANYNNIAAILKRRTSHDWQIKSMHPFNEINGANKFADKFYSPLLHSLKHLQRRQDIFFAGLNCLDGNSSIWVVSMGHLMGLFDEDFLNIPATRKMAFLRYCEFNQVKGDKITNTALFFDLPHLMIQAGLKPFEKQTAAHLVQPGPITHDGLCFDIYDPKMAENSLTVINDMIKHLGKWDSGMKIENELALSWNEDMIWWGPAGIGATYTISRYAKQHALSFRAAFGKRSNTNHICRLAEGNYGGFFGWPNFKAVNEGGFLGVEPSDDPCEFRVVDIYRVDGNKLAENWVFIDFLHWFKQQGIDIL